MNRREILIEKMNELESKGMGCQECPGNCCTFEANSMLVTPLEALELVQYLKEKNLLGPSLKNKLIENIKNFRLEPKYLINKRSYLRKTYTCPFFNHQKLGCPLPREIKPYGCLAFDSHHPEKKASEHCYSEVSLLELREQKHLEEIQINEDIRIKYDLLWEKAPIPNGVLEIWEKSISEDPAQV